MLNKVELIGRIVDQPVIKNISKNDTPIYKVDSTIAVDDNYVKDKTHFFRFTAWNKNAEFLSNYVKKGDLIAIAGSLNYRSWKDEAGRTSSIVDVSAEEVYIVSHKNEPKEEEDKPRTDTTKIDPKTLKVEFGDVDDDDLPF